MEYIQSYKSVKFRAPSVIFGCCALIRFVVGLVDLFLARGYPQLSKLENQNEINHHMTSYCLRKALCHQVRKCRAQMGNIGH